MNVTKFLADTRKFLIALAGLVAVVIESGALHGNAQNIAQSVSAAVAAILVYLVPNGQTVDMGGQSPAADLPASPAGPVS